MIITIRSIFRNTPSTHQALGWLMGSAVTNRAIMRLPLPTVLFEKLLDGEAFQAGLGKLLAFDPAAHASLVQARGTGGGCKPPDLTPFNDIQPHFTPFSYHFTAFYNPPCL